MEFTPSIAFSFIAIIISLASLIILWKSYHATHEWNRRRATVDILVQLYVKEVMSIRDKLTEILGCQIWDSHNYNDFVKKYDENTQNNLKLLFYKMLSIYSLISGQIKNNVLDEEISYHFLAFQFTRTYTNLLPLINKWRDEYNERHLFIDFEFISEKWKVKMQERAKAYSSAVEKERKYKEML